MMNHRKRIAGGDRHRCPVYWIICRWESLVGHLVDEQFSTEPMGLLVGVSLGSGSGDHRLVKSEIRLKNDDKLNCDV